MTRSISPRTVELVKATVPALEAHGLDIVHEMYARLFQNPDIHALFNQSNQGPSDAQPRALTGAILAYASNIENIAALSPAVERIAQKHVGLQILPEHYPHVADALLGAISHVLGDSATEEVLAAWGEAYWFLADILIARERRIYDQQASAEGGWSGWRDFRIVEVIPESSVIRSFILHPVDGGPVMAHKAGQYLTFWFEIPGHPPVKRNYSISSAVDGKGYRISVKREPMGLASGWLHEQLAGTVLKVAAPAGEFVLADQPQRPVVLLSGGVGLTPMVAMLETLVAQNAQVPVHYIHGTHDRNTHAMRDHVRGLAAGRDDIRITDFHQTPLPGEAAGRDYDMEGLITEEWLLENTPSAQADYYICGPRPFLRAAVLALSLAGVASDRIHYEFFGPADELLAA